jgi:hypothetical protein
MDIDLTKGLMVEIERDAKDVCARCNGPVTLGTYTHWVFVDGSIMPACNSLHAQDIINGPYAMTAYCSVCEKIRQWESARSLTQGWYFFEQTCTPERHPERFMIQPKSLPWRAKKDISVGGHLLVCEGEVYNNVFHQLIKSRGGDIGDDETVDWKTLYPKGVVEHLDNLPDGMFTLSPDKSFSRSTVDKSA